MVRLRSPVVHPDDDRAVWEEIPAGDLTLRIRRPPSAEALIDEHEFAVDERLPYWAEVWPSGRVLCGVLAGMDLAGKSVLELGAGIGTGAMVSAMRGARAMSTDWYPAAVEFSQLECHRILGFDMESVVVDWCNPPDEVTDRRAVGPRGGRGHPLRGQEWHRAGGAHPPACRAWFAGDHRRPPSA